MAIYYEINKFSQNRRFSNLDESALAGETVETF